MTVHQRRAARARRYGLTNEFDLVYAMRLEAALAAAGLVRVRGPGVSQDFTVAQVAAGLEPPSPLPDLHARRASQELQRMWLRAVHRSTRKARRFRGVRRRYVQAPKGREIAQGWYVE